MSDIVPTTPNWITNLRDAAQKMIKPEDIEAIIANQVKLAKEGDRNAIKFVFEQVLGGSAVKAATLIQHNHYNSPTDEEVISRRNGQPLPDPESRWECVKCKAIYRGAMSPPKCSGCNGTRFNRKAAVTA